MTLDTVEKPHECLRGMAKTLTFLRQCGNSFGATMPEPLAGSGSTGRKGLGLLLMNCSTFPLFLLLPRVR